MLVLISLLIGYIITLVITSSRIIFVINNYQRFGTKLNAALIFGTLFNALFIYSIFIILSYTVYISEKINIIFWKVQLISGFGSVLMTCVIYSFAKKYKRIPIFPFLFFTILFGLLIGSLHDSSAIVIQSSTPSTVPYINLDPSSINFIFDFSTGIITALYQLSCLTYMMYVAIRIYQTSRKRENSLGLLFNTFFFSIPILLYILYINTQFWIFRDLHLVLIWVNIVAISLMLKKKPDIFMALTQTVYSINIYHKSGILLYSYKFKGTNSETESAMWGNILIGINHILSEFIETREQIKLLKTKNSEILVDYNNNYGFAVIVISNYKNDILALITQQFMKEFCSKYEAELSEIMDLNKIINVSEFEETKNIIEKNFQTYL